MIVYGFGPGMGCSSRMRCCDIKVQILVRGTRKRFRGFVVYLR